MADLPEPVPTFYLYGEAQRAAEENFVHAEPLELRSRPAGWTIQPHAHRDLDHLILITHGGGTMRAEAAIGAFVAPCLLLVPARIVHGFRWHADSAGFVVTLASGFRDELVRRDRAVGAVFAATAAVPLGREAADLVASQAEVLIKELGWLAPGHRTAVETALGAIVVQALRGLASHVADDDLSRGPQAALVARFRGLVDERFRLREPIEDYARRLGVGLTTLRTACARVAGASPIEIVNARTFVEAKRALCYSNQTVAEVAYGLGFADPAYFSRAFSRHAGISPKAFRGDHAARRQRAAA